MYADVFKRVIDFCLSLLALIVLSPFFLILVLAGTIAMRGNPFFVQPRPGRKGTDGKEIIFYLLIVLLLVIIKFRIFLLLVILLV